MHINGFKWRFVVEQYSKGRVFGKTTVNISGRSVTAYLAEPYASRRSFLQAANMSSRALAEAELTRTGLVTGYSMDWQLVDALGWQVPANSWSFTDLTPIAVINEIAQAGGGIVQSHPSEKNLIVMAEYPRPFWQWEAADVMIPQSLLWSQNIQYRESPLYNGVFVSGEMTGVSALVKREGTAGDFQASPFAHPLTSDAAAARSKGIAILSAGGKMQDVSLSCPFHRDLGLISVGKLVDDGKIGLVRGVNIEVRRQNGLKITQNINVERHLDK